MCITAAMLYNTAAMAAEKVTAGMAPVTAGCAALLGCKERQEVVGRCGRRKDWLWY